MRGDVPIAWRDDRTLQVGDATRTVVIPEIDRSLVAWLLTMRGERTLAEALTAAESEGLRRSSALRLVRQVLPTGLVDDAAALPDSLRTASPDLRDRLQGELAAARVAHGSAHRAADILDRRLAATVAIDGDGAVADAVAAALAHAGVGGIERATKLSSSSRRSRRASAGRACHVLCDVAHPDAAAGPEALALDIPHLPVAVFGSRAVIGPLVLPGLTGCLRCRDLHRADQDSAWPRIAIQFQGRRYAVPPVDSALVATAAGWAALQVLAWIESDRDPTGPLRWPAGWPGDAPPSVGGQVTMTVPGGVARRVDCPPHPLCGCRWR